ncbi:hypothetical protein ABPG74_016714 [Tetrahymena malaccensis]
MYCNEIEERKEICSRHKRICMFKIKKNAGLDSNNVQKLITSIQSQNEEYQYVCLKCYLIMNKTQKSNQKDLKNDVICRSEIHFPIFLNVQNILLLKNDLLAVQFQQKIEIIDLNLQKKIVSYDNRLTHPNIFQNILKLASLHRNQYLICLIKSNKSFIYNWKTNKILRVIQKQIIHFKHLKDHTYIVVNTIQSGFDVINLYNLSNNKFLTQFSKKSIGINTIDSAKNGQYIACGGDEMEIYIFTNTGQLMYIINTDNWITQLFFQPQSLNILFQTYDQAIYYYDKETQKTNKYKNLEFLDLFQIDSVHKQFFCKYLNKKHQKKSYVIYDFVNNKVTPFNLDQFNKLPTQFTGIISLKEQKMAFLGQRNIVFVREMIK